MATGTACLLPYPAVKSSVLNPTSLTLSFNKRQTLLDGTAPYAYFVESGIASVVVSVENGNTVEVGIIGIDGVVGLPILLGAEGSPGRTFMQIGGSGFRMGAAVLKEEFERPGRIASPLAAIHAGLLCPVRTNRGL